MSGMLLKSKGEEDFENIKFIEEEEEKEDELGDLLDDEELEMLLLGGD